MTAGKCGTIKTHDTARNYNFIKLSPSPWGAVARIYWEWEAQSTHTHHSVGENTELQTGLVWKGH